MGINQIQTIKIFRIYLPLDAMLRSPGGPFPPIPARELDRPTGSPCVIFADFELSPQDSIFTIFLNPANKRKILLAMLLYIHICKTVLFQRYEENFWPFVI